MTAPFALGRDYATRERGTWRVAYIDHGETGDIYCREVTDGKVRGRVHRWDRNGHALDLRSPEYDLLRPEGAA